MQESDREEVRRIVREELARHGLTPEDPHADHSLLDWCRKHMGAFESAGNIGWRGVMLALVTGITLAVWEGVKALLNKAQ